MAKFGKDAAKEDLTRASKHKDSIVAGAKKFGFKPSLIAAIGSRETRWLDKFFLGDIDPHTHKAHGHGPMQVDDRSFGPWCSKWISDGMPVSQAIEKGCEVLAAKYKSIGRLVPGLDETMHLRAAIAAYNCGEGNVKKVLLSKDDVDTRTTGKDYSKDVLERAKTFAELGFDDPNSGAQTPKIHLTETK